MSDIVVRLDLLAEQAKDRPAGYYEDVLAAGVVGPKTVRLSREEYSRLIAKYRRGPSLLQKAKNFTTSAAKHIAAGMPMASEEEIARRFAICQACEFLKDGACTKCGCPVVRQKKFLSKLSWADQSCPIGKWGNGK